MNEAIVDLQGGASIELRLEELSQLFDPFDPFPMPTRDLARSAEDFIVGWARELPRGQAFRIIVHLSQREAQSPAAAGLADALRRHFTYRAERMSGDLHEMFRIGRLSLFIGLAVLGGCVLGGRLVSSLFGPGDISSFFAEGLIILGWVANWRPIEIFLYDWWPLAQRRHLYRCLADASVEVRSVREDKL
ncbi:hypothetical protein [Candidatus Viadribacter manganicus]|uniref:Uncharacterized protein n=1 Tax=Candidatus Viadribacter manganicus TaxID=1759059 RepID=A0A1B1AGH1_9PROT|nr:hypothetical protein [Candidatus Viadribacter manganicus]ANP45641.1 hypothetical protein ATE48_06760 [Candidatus Viadribacter manganicus]